MTKKIIRPLKGIDVDSSVSRRDDNTIYIAKNLRVNNHDDSRLGEYTNIKGTNIIIGYSAACTILKIHKLNKKFIIFLMTMIGDTICLVDEDDIPINGEAAISLDFTNYYWSTSPGHKVFSGSMGFAAGLEIEVRSYYESDLVQKIYWTVNNPNGLALPTQPLRSLNVIYSAINDPSSYSVQDLDIVPSVVMTEPHVNQTVSGNLLSGKIFYAYKLINNNGSETAISPISKGYNLTTASNTDANDYKYKGVGFDVNTNKGINLTISNIDTSFNKIKIYSIHYLNDVSLPKVSLIYDGSSSTTLTTNDVGIPILDISPEEFLSANGLLLNEGQLEIKNNRLFIGNYSEELFDIDNFATDDYWDARSYRFIGSGNAVIWNSALSSFITIDRTVPDYSTTTIPKTYDCVNKSNDIAEWGTPLSSNYIYQIDGTTIGSSGPNIQIEQVEHYFLSPDDSGENTKWYSKKISGGYDSFARPENDTYNKIFKLEEVYRLSIQFRNSKNQYSYPKWICDYKYVYDTTNYDPIQFLATPVRVEMPLYHLNVTVSNIPLDENGDAYQYRIMYVPLTESDRSVYWGLFIPLPYITAETAKYRAVGINKEYDLSNTNIDQDSETPVTFSNKYLEFISPEYCLGDKKMYSRFSLFKNALNVSIIRNNVQTHQSNIYKIFGFVASSYLNVNKSLSLQQDVEYDVDIEGTIPLSGTDVFIRKGETVVFTEIPYYTFNGKHKLFGNSNKGRCQILQPTSSISSPYTYTQYWGCAYVDNFESRYGGTSYNSRKMNGYVALTDFSNTAYQEVKGDVYSGVFEYLRQISDNSHPFIRNNQIIGGSNIDIIQTNPSYTAGNNEIVIFPTYSVQNLKLRNDSYFTSIYTETSSYMIHEFSGVYTDLDPTTLRENTYVNKTGTPFTQLENLYLYNNTYSRDQNLFEYFEKQDTNSILKSFNNRIVASDLKILGESSDSFLNINPSTYIDVDGQYGEILELRIFNNRLYFFQEHAIGIVSVNEQATTNINGDATLVLGSVGLLGRYDYITINNGINNSNHVITSDNSLYFIDEIRKEFLRISENGLEKISITKNINNIVKTYDLTGARIVHNRKYNEIQFHCKINDDGIKYRAFIFNEIQDAFIGYFEYPFGIFDSEPLERIDIVDALVLTDTNKIESLNDGDYNKFENTYTPSEITFLITANQDDVVLFNIVEFLMTQVDSNGAYVDFIDTIRIYSNNHDTGVLDFATNVERRFEKYRTNRLRNYTGSNERILSNHIYVTITTKDNSVGGNNRVFFRDLITSFTEYNYYG